jgi:hypothetical protein
MEMTKPTRHGRLAPEENAVTPLFVFCADLHLEDGAWSTRPGIYGDSYYSFAQIVDYCIEHKLSLIMGGDILEKKQNLARPIAKLCEGLTRLQDAGIKAYYIQGNHEFDRNAPWLSIHPWPTYMHGASFDINGVKVSGFDWLPRGDIQEAFKRVPQNTDVLVTHQVWKDFMGEIGRTECELTDVHNVQTVLAGDFHVTKVVESVNAQGQPIKMLSPGSTCMQDMGESAEKFFFVIAKNAAGQFEFVPVPLATRKVANYVVKDTETLDKLCAGQLTADIAALRGGLPPELDKPLVRIKFDKRLPDAYLRIATTVGESAHLFCEAIVERGGARAETAKPERARNDLLSALADLSGEDEEAYKLAVALLGAADPAKEFDVQFSKYTRELEDATLEIGSAELGTPSPANV